MATAGTPPAADTPLGNHSPRPAWWPLGVLLALLAFAHGAWYAAIIPLWQAPDEPAHVEYILLIAERGRPTEEVDPAIQRRIVADLVARDFFLHGGGQRPPDDELSFAAVWPGQARYAGRQPAYHLLAAVVARLFSEASLPTQVLALRLFSALLFALTVAAIFATVRVVAPARPLLAVGSAGAAALLPMPAFLGGTVNNDNLANLVGASTFLALALAERRGYRPEFVLALLALAALAFYTKRTTLFIPPLVGLALFSAIWRLGWRARFATLVVGLLLLLALAAAVETFPPLREAVAFSADRYLANESVASNLAAIQGITPSWQAVLDRFVFYSDEFFRSALGLFGWFNVPLLPVFFQLAWLVTVIAAGGAVLFALRGAARLDEPGQATLRWLALGLLGALGLVFVYALYFSQDGTAPQGRYLFVALAPLLFWLLGGLAELVPARWRAAALVLGLVALLLFDLLALTSALLPVYYGSSTVYNVVRPL